MYPSCKNGLHHESIAMLTAPRYPHSHFAIILWLFFMKYNIGKLNLCSKTDISKTAWINTWKVIFFLENCCFSNMCWISWNSKMKSKIQRWYVWKINIQQVLCYWNTWKHCRVWCTAFTTRKWMSDGVSRGVQ